MDLKRSFMISHNVDGCMMMYAVMKSVIWWRICLRLRFTVRNADTLRKRKNEVTLYAVFSDKQYRKI